MTLLLLKSLLVFATAGLMLLCLCRASASARHLVCLLTLASVLALPLFSAALPGWRVVWATQEPTLAQPTPAQAPTLPKGEGAEIRVGIAANLSAAPALPNSLSSPLGRTPATEGRGSKEVGFLYLLGVLLASARPLLGLWGIRRLSLACIGVDDAPTLAAAEGCAVALGLKRLPHLCRAHVCVPMTWGWIRAIVVLPLASADWPEDRLRSVLLHEMAHIKRRDWPGHRLADLACAVYWFHPLVWLTARRLRAESETACDDLVLSSGIAAPDYARHLLDIAGALPRPLPSQSAIAMAQTPNIKRRILMILDTARSRRTVTRRVLLFGVALTAATLIPLAAVRISAQAKAEARRLPAKPMSKATARVSAVHAVPGEFDAYQILNAGRELTPQEASGLEKRLAAKPDDYAAHLQLLGYEQSRSIYNEPSVSFPAKTAYQQQVFWLIQNHPESVLAGTPETMLLKRNDPAAFEQGKTLWLEQVARQPNNAAILGNAAAYCLLSDAATAEKLLRQAQALEPKNPQWPSKLGQLYRLQGPHPSAEAVQQSAVKALAEYEDAARLANKTGEPSTSSDLAKTAFDAGEYGKTRTYAEALLKRGEEIAAAGKADPRQPAFIFQQNDDDIHEANMVLGRLALHDGDTAGAEAHLLAMGRVSGSSTLDSFGPNMQLADDLLKAGRREAVLAYFDECAKFWKDKKLRVWRSEVETGKRPDFGGNLVY